MIIPMYEGVSMNIKELRKATGLSQSKFAAYFGIPVRTLQEWEQERQHPPSYVIAMMERIWQLEHPEKS